MDERLHRLFVSNRRQRRDRLALEGVAGRAGQGKVVEQVDAFRLHLAKGAEPLGGERGVFPDDVDNLPLQVAQPERSGQHDQLDSPDLAGGRGDHLEDPWILQARAQFLQVIQHLRACLRVLQHADQPPADRRIARVGISASFL